MSGVRLGSYAHVSISVRSLHESSQFYEKLGFRHVYGNGEPHPWAIYTDGMLNIHLYEFHFSSPALHYFSAHMKDKVLELMRSGIRPEQQRSKDGIRTQHVFYDPNELSVMLMHHDDEDMPKPDGTSQSRIGRFGELSISTDNVKTSVAFWQKLNFAIRLEGEQPYPWATLSDGTMNIGLHQTTAFTLPALTYFLDDVAAAIASLRPELLSLMEEISSPAGEPAGAILTAPGGQSIFLLKGKPLQTSQNG